MTQTSLDSYYGNIMAEKQCDHIVQTMKLAGVTIKRCVRCGDVVTREILATTENHSQGGVMCR